MSLNVVVASAEHTPYSAYLCELMAESAKQRGTGIAKRTPEYISQKMQAGKAVVALDGKQVVGFSYIETWGHGRFVANSGLIVAPEYRHKGLALKIKRRIFALSRHKYPNAKIFGITTGLAVMKINSALGYIPVTFSELTADTEFWKGCQECRNYDILERNDFRMCLCTGMLYDPARHQSNLQRTLDWCKIALYRSRKAIKRWWRRRRRRNKKSAAK
ncbi:N-acetyltransferase [Bacteroidia bacterium]|nr:N-acetyltransferase [Bacteroidia bacterium]